MGGEPLDSYRSTRRDGGRVRGLGGAYPTPRAMATPAVRSKMLGDRRVCIGAPRCCRERAFVSDVASAKRRVSSRRKISFRAQGDPRRERRRSTKEAATDTRVSATRRKSRSGESGSTHGSTTDRQGPSTKPQRHAFPVTAQVTDRAPQGSTEKTSVGSILR